MEKSIWQLYGEKGGRPPKFETPEQLQQKIQEYIEHIIETESKTTLSGLVLFCGFSDITNFDRQAGRGDGFAYTIKKARLFIGKHYEELSQNGNAGGIFGVKNILGWTDKQEVKQEITEKKQIFKIGDKEIEF